jgi:hypothetical protein
MLLKKDWMRRELLMGGIGQMVDGTMIMGTLFDGKALTGKATTTTNGMALDKSV